MKDDDDDDDDVIVIPNFFVQIVMNVMRFVNVIY